MDVRSKLPMFLLFLLLCAVGVRGVHLFRDSITTGDEALVALRSLGLLEHGHGWTPYWNGDPDVHKPPLYLWLVAACYRILGVGETAVRLPSLAAFLGLLGLTYVLGRRVFNPWVGLMAAVFAAIHPTLVLQSSVGMLDTTMILFTLGGAWFLLHAGEQPRAYLGWGLCCGLALLTKGPGATPIFVVSLLYLLAVRRKAIRVPLLCAGLAVAAIVAGIWFGSQYWMHHDIFIAPYYTDFVDYRLKHSWQDTGLYTKSLHYLWASWGGLAPFFFAASVLAWFGGRTETASCDAEVPLATTGSADKHGAFLIFLLGFVPLVMVSLVRQQMSWYMLPAIVPMSLFAAQIVVGMLQGRYSGFLRFLFGLLLAAGLVLPFVYTGPAIIRVMIGAAAGLTVVLGLNSRKMLRQAGGGVFLVGLVLAWRGGLALDNPYVNMLRARDSTPLRQLAHLLPDTNAVPGRMVVNFRHYPLNSLMFYARRDSQQLGVFAQQEVAPDVPYLCVLEGGGCREFLQGLEVQTLTNFAGYEVVLIRNVSSTNVIPWGAAPAAIPEAADLP